MNARQNRAVITIRPVECFLCCAPLCRGGLTWFFMALAGLMLPTPTWALILAEGDLNTNTTAPSDDPGWENVGRYGDCTATYLGNGWALTADHLTRAPTIIFDGTAVPVEPGSEVTLHNSPIARVTGDARDLAEDADVSLTEFTDLRLVRLAEDPGLPALSIPSQPPDFVNDWTDVLMIGHGRDREANISFWSVHGLVDQEYAWEELPEQPTGRLGAPGYKYAPTKTKRWGTNTIVASALIQSDAHDVFTMTTQFRDDLSLSTEFESQATPGDSGGAVFYDNGGAWELIGVMVRVGNVREHPPEMAVFGDLTFFADLTVYRNEILEIISPGLQPGDANQDLRFDQLDIVKVLQAGKYLTGEPATWGEGDWDAAPGGSPGAPPLGDGLFNQLDIVAALASGRYLSGGQAALSPTGGMTESIQLDLLRVPEPSTAVLMTLGLMATALWRRRRPPAR